ncbi:MAG: glutathione peroxidase [Bacteroidetes bacterium]|nr:glutathione peroxidase [Bacteroidota bacterium]
MSFYELEFRLSQGKIFKTDELKGKTVLIVNTATGCGLAPQFEELEKLYQKYKDRDLRIIGFPSNQFNNQEPESNSNMEEFCRINHGVTFQLTEKTDVNGKNAHPVFKFLKKALPGTLGESIKWNFTKFLITPDGRPFKRYAPTTSPAEIEEDVLGLTENLIV